MKPRQFSEEQTSEEGAEECETLLVQCAAQDS